MRRSHWLVMPFALAACFRGPGAPVPARNDREALRYVIDSMLRAPDTRTARFGVLIVDPERGDTLYSHDAGKLFVPASNMKIVTAAVALDALGPDFRFSTTFMARGPITNGMLDGDLLVAGRGDPSVSDQMAHDGMIPLRAIADSLYARGIRRVRGSIVAFGDAFPDANVGFGWAWDDLDTPSGAAIDELFFNEGISQLRVRGARVGDPPDVFTSPARTFPRVRNSATTVTRGTPRDSFPRLEAVLDTLHGNFVLKGAIPEGDSATLDVAHPDPDQAFIAALREALNERGITVADSVVSATAKRDTLFINYSAPLSQVLPAFLKPSQNQIGEILLKTVALQRTDTGTARVGRRLVADRLRAWGIEGDGFLVFDGSGLSRRDMLTPETLVRVLDAMRRAPTFQVYFDALPIAGVDGTLRSRMRATPAEANVRGKTGTLGNVRSLSGYVTTADGRHLIFSILSNNYLTPTDYVTRIQDSIAVRMARLGGRGGGF